MQGDIKTYAYTGFSWLSKNPWFPSPNVLWCFLLPSIGLAIFLRNMSSGDSSQSPFNVPFDELPNPKQVWVGKPGSREEGLGKLAILTPEVVANAAATEIKTGRRVTMGWELTKLDYPNLNRQPCHHQIIPLLGGVAFDDVYTMNPRRSCTCTILPFARGTTPLG